ncbi:MAG: HNH endonuclease [Sphingomonas sp.]
MAEARKIGRAQFLETYASGRGSDNWYVEVDGVQYDLKALWAAAHRPPIKPSSFKTYDAIPGFKAMDFVCASGIAAPHGLPGDAAATPQRRPRTAPPQPKLPQPAPDPDAAIRPLANPVAVSPAKHFKPTGYWLFLSNPTRWDAAAWRASEADELLYLVSKDDRNFIQPGDLGLLRVNKRRGQPAELIAAVEVLEAPRSQPEPDPTFFRIESDAAPALRVKLSVISKHSCEPVRSDALPRTPVYHYLHDAVPRTTLPIDREAFLHVAKQLGVDGEWLAVRRASRSTEGIERLEAGLEGATPVRRERVSKVIERGPIGDAVKLARGGRCQICEALGRDGIAFLKVDGSAYAEAHHIIPVAQLRPGSLAHHNIMVLCPNHHRQAHYGGFTLVKDAEDHWLIEVDQTRLRIEKTRLAAMPVRASVRPLDGRS